MESLVPLSNETDKSGTRDNSAHVPVPHKFPNQSGYKSY